MDNENKKSLQLQYKERDVIGGVYAIKNNVNGKILLMSATDLQGFKNRFNFAQKTNLCIHIKLKGDWERFGNTSFSLETLEELKKKDDQTIKEFKDDLSTLEEMWKEKFNPADLY